MRRKRRRLYYAAHRRGLVPYEPPVSSRRPEAGPVDRWLLSPTWVSECRVMAREGRALGMAFFLLGKCLAAEAAEVGC